MKKVALLVMAMFAGLFIYAQEKNGTVYSRHPAIEKTKTLWSAFQKGDKATYGSLLADTLKVFYNGNMQPQKKEDHLKSLDWWGSDFEGLKVVDDSPAYPDAIEYDKGGLWVQDWLLITGLNKKSGINLDLHLHNMYHFNKDGKIAMMILYFDNAQFEAINASELIQENGKVFINHPYIITVRKLCNAYCAKNIEAMSAFYSPKARFQNSTRKMMETIDLAGRKKELANEFSQSDNIKMQQVGYPDCIYYAKGDSYVVYSWWVRTDTSNAGNKKSEFPVMLSHTFNKEGKIVSEMAYFSSNHFQ